MLCESRDITACELSTDHGVELDRKHAHSYVQVHGDQLNLILLVCTLLYQGRFPQG